MAPMMTLSFPDATGHIFTASDTVQGHVDFRMETDPKSGKTKFDAIHLRKNRHGPGRSSGRL